MENQTKFFVDTIRELERNNTELELQNRILRARLGFVEGHTEGDAVQEEPAQQEPAGKRMIVEGIAYESRNFRSKFHARKFKHFPLVQVGVFATDRDAAMYRKERFNSSYIYRLGTCLIECDPNVKRVGRK